MKYKSCLTSAVSVIALQHQVKMANLEDSYKFAMQACGSNDFLFFIATPGHLPFFFMYKCLF